MESEETTASAAGSTASHKSVTRILSSCGAWVVGILTALIIFFIDQGTKLLVVTKMQIGERIPVIDGLLWWYSIRNSGATLSVNYSPSEIF